MKKTLFMLLIAMTALNCSSDDDNADTPPDEANDALNIRITQVNPEQNTLVLTNFSQTTTDVSQYWLCLGPGTYVQVGDSTQEGTALAQGETVLLNYTVDDTAAGLSLFTDNQFSSTDPDILIDYIQWGAANQARVAQAVTAGRWDDASNFVTAAPPYDFIGESETIGVLAWE